MLRNLIVNICDYYGVSVIDLYSKSGFNLQTISTLTFDNLHPNTDGKIVLSKIIAESFLNGKSDSYSRVVTSLDLDDSGTLVKNQGSIPTNNSIVRFDGISGTLIKNSNATLDDSGILTVSTIKPTNLTPLYFPITSFGTNYLSNSNLYFIASESSHKSINFAIFLSSVELSF